MFNRSQHRLGIARTLNKDKKPCHLPLVITARQTNIFEAHWHLKQGDILWFVSNCKTDHTKRMEFARALERATTLRLDIFGQCGSVTSSPEDELWKRYRFYLAFENSHCKDYITEKFFKVLDHEVIPVVRGAPLR